MSSPPHGLLLTGVPGIGKTTLIRTVAERLDHHRLAGFTTEEIREGGSRVGFEVETLGGRRATLAHVGITSHHRVGRYGVDLPTFESLLPDALPLGAEGYLIDEIGKMECFSSLFVTTVRRILDAGRPVVATIAFRGGGFIEEVKARPDVLFWELDRARRDAMVDQVVAWVEQRLVS